MKKLVKLSMILFLLVAAGVEVRYAVQRISTRQDTSTMEIWPIDPRRAAPFTRHL